jgi:hypothetical protein
MTFYKAVYRPAVLRAGFCRRNWRFTRYGTPMRRSAWRRSFCRWGLPDSWAKVTTTLTAYAHLFEDDHADAMVRLAR